MITPKIESAAAARLAALGIAVTAPGPGMLEFDAVPCCPTSFSKPRTNLLLVEQRECCHIFVDQDLAYHGPDRRLRKAFARGPVQEKWRWIRETARDFQAGLDSALRCLSSPLPPDLTSRLLCEIPPGSAPRREQPAWGPLLHLAGRDLTGHTPHLQRLPAAWAHLADRLASACAGKPAPTAALLWGDARPETLRAVLHHVAAALRPQGPIIEVSCATLAAGLVSAADADNQLVRLLAEARAAEPALFLYYRLDLLCSRSAVCLGVLADARLRGPGFLATTSEILAHALGRDPDLQTMVVPARLPALAQGDRRAWLAAELDAAGFAAATSALAFLLQDTGSDPLALQDRLTTLSSLRAAGRTDLFPDDFPQDGAGVWPTRSTESEGKNPDKGEEHGNPETP